MRSVDFLVLCEASGVVRRAAQAAGFSAVSVDLRAAEDGEEDFHIVGDALQIGRQIRARIVIAHPECTYLSCAGVHLLTADKTQAGPRWQAFREAAAHFNEFKTLPHDRIAIENSRFHEFARARCGRATQVVQPCNFGDWAMKYVQLHLINLPKLVPTDNICRLVRENRDLAVNIENIAAPRKERRLYRSKFWPKVAAAMVHQWGAII